MGRWVSGQMGRSAGGSRGKWAGVGGQKDR